MIRKIIKIDEAKCNGCGACASACHEGAIEMVDGKARLTREDYCDGLGDCLPACPTNAISFEEREAPEYNEEAVLEAKKKKEAASLPCGCPGSASRVIRREAPQKSISQGVDETIIQQSISQEAIQTTTHQFHNPGEIQKTLQETPTFPISQPTSQLSQWPVQIKLVPVQAPYFENANLLIAADCTAYAYGDFHNMFIRNHVTLIGCPKLDEGDYAEKLTAIIQNNNIKSVTIVRMEVPCCGGIENAVKRALQASGKMIPWRVVVISTEGNVLES